MNKYFWIYFALKFHIALSILFILSIKTDFFIFSIHRCLIVLELPIICIPSGYYNWNLFLFLIIKFFYLVMKMVSWLWKKGDKKEEEEVDEDELKKKGFNP